MNVTRGEMPLLLNRSFSVELSREEIIDILNDHIKRKLKINISDVGYDLSVSGEDGVLQSIVISGLEVVNIKFINKDNQPKPENA